MWLYQTNNHLGGWLVLTNKTTGGGITSRSSVVVFILCFLFRFSFATLHTTAVCCCRSSGSLCIHRNQWLSCKQCSQ